MDAIDAVNTQNGELKTGSYISSLSMTRIVSGFKGTALVISKSPSECKRYLKASILSGASKMSHVEVIPFTPVNIISSGVNGNVYWPTYKSVAIFEASGLDISRYMGPSGDKHRCELTRKITTLLNVSSTDLWIVLQKIRDTLYVCVKSSPDVVQAIWSKPYRFDSIHMTPHCMLTNLNKGARVRYDMPSYIIQYSPVSIEFHGRYANYETVSTVSCIRTVFVRFFYLEATLIAYFKAHVKD